VITLKTLNVIAMILVWAGGLNWGLVGLFDLNLVEVLVGPLGLETIVYILVGLATVYSIYLYSTGKKGKK